MRAHGSMDSGGGGGGGGGGGRAPVHGSHNIVTGATVSFHQHNYSGGLNYPGVFGSWLLPC